MDGTGIVHQAPAFGEDDHRIAMSNGIVRHDEIPPCPIDDSGKFTKQVHDFTGLNVKVCYWSPPLYRIVRFTVIGCRWTYPESVESKRPFDCPVYYQPQLPILLEVRDFI